MDVGVCVCACVRACVSVNGLEVAMCVRFSESFGERFPLVIEELKGT